MSTAVYRHGVFRHSIQVICKSDPVSGGELGIVMSIGVIVRNSFTPPVIINLVVSVSVAHSSCALLDTVFLVGGSRVESVDEVSTTVLH